MPHTITENPIDYFVHYVELPLTVRGVTVPGTDGSFDIYINSRLTAEEKKEAFSHELRHISYGHFYDLQSVAVNEVQAERHADINKSSDLVSADIPLVNSLSADTGGSSCRFNAVSTLKALIPKGNAEYFAYEIADESMEPVFMKGEKVLLRTANFFSDGDIVLAFSKIDGKTLFRRLMKGEGSILLMPQNASYPARFFKDKSSVILCALFDRVIAE